jgi:hypothetical protein
VEVGFTGSNGEITAGENVSGSAQAKKQPNFDWEKFAGLKLKSVISTVTREPGCHWGSLSAGT